MLQVIIIGAGLAGLTCAKVLNDHGMRDFLILEQSDGVGGRVRTDHVDGFYLDRGFQVLFTAYPMVQKFLNLPQLDLRFYQPGAALVQNGQPYLLGDPLRDRRSLIPSLLNPLVTGLDKLQILRLRALLRFKSPAQIWQESDISTAEFIRQFGFSEQIFKSFFQPFYRGILLDPDLQTSAHLFQFYFKMLAEGSIVTPKLGLGQISDQLAEGLTSNQLALKTKVTEISTHDSTAVGVTTESGELIKAAQIICATDAPSVQPLLSQESSRLPLPETPRGVTNLYFSSTQSLTSGAYIHLNAMGSGWINTVMELTQVSPDLAPPGLHLYSVVGLGTPDRSEAELVTLCQTELQHWFPQLQIEHLTFLRSYVIPFAQFNQPVGIQHLIAQIQSPCPDLILAGEYLQQSSIEGAMRSGEQAAYQALRRQ